MLIIGINLIVLVAVFIRKCSARRNSRSANISSGHQPQQETSFISNAAANFEDRYYEFSLGPSSVEMDFHYYDEVPVYAEAECSNVIERTKV